MSQFSFRNQSLLLTYQQTHSESSANGITNAAIKIALFFATLMCVALFRSNKETVIQTGVSTDSIRLPWYYFFISGCWILLSGSWMLWNQEARIFVYRKFCKFDNIRIHRGYVEKVRSKQKSKPKSTRTGKQTCVECDVEYACPNCIARQVLKRKQLVSQNKFTDPECGTLPGAVDSPKHLPKE
jgi:hypothetical protein